MKKSIILFVIVLLTASTTLFAKPSPRDFNVAVATRQTEQLASNLELTKKQTKKLLAINEKYLKKSGQLIGQRMELSVYTDLQGNIQQTFFEMMSAYNESKIQEIKSILKDDQLTAYESLLTSQPAMPRNSARNMPDMRRLRSNS
jgi:hypothetical protein